MPSFIAGDSVWYECVVTFWSTCKSFLVRPRATAAALAADERRLRLGLAAFLVPVAGYLVVYQLVFVLFNR